MRKFFLTPGGVQVWIDITDEGRVQGKDYHGVTARVATGDANKLVRVDLDMLANFGTLSDPNSPDEIVDGHPWHAVAILAIIDGIDSDHQLATRSKDSVLVVAADEVEGLLHRTPMTDRELRRYIARWIHAVYSGHTLDVEVTLTRLDELVTGCRQVDLQRNVGLLAAEGYLNIPRRTKGQSPVFKPTARLIREVERYGAAKEDVASDRDYAATIGAYDILQDEKQAILLEWTRYQTAQTSVELASVFRALAPTVESVLRRVLSTYGTKVAGNLGPMIGDLRSRQLGDRGMWSRLNHIVVFARDLAEHGEHLPEPTLRIACEEALALLPQLAVLAKP